MVTWMENGICAPMGLQIAGIHCGIRKDRSKKDLALIYSSVMCTTVSTCTLNKVRGAPIAATERHLQDGHTRAIVCNPDNVNTYNVNREGIANRMCELYVRESNLNAEDIIVASTGVIGEPLSITPFEEHIQELVSALNVRGGSDACEEIMTTDTSEKQFAVTFTLQGRVCHIGGMAKGSGMIHPNMATMLAFLTTDMAISVKLLGAVVYEVVADTFNMVSVDGDTSTNGMLGILVNGLTKNPEICERNEDYGAFKQALMEICVEISRNIAKDGEGATKLLTCRVAFAKDTKTAKAIARPVITSSLFRAVIFRRGTNWGRILCAIEYVEGDFDIHKVGVTPASKAGRVLICKDDAGCDFDEEETLYILSENEIGILIGMKQGSTQATAWDCDLTYNYMKISGDYRTQDKGDVSTLKIDAMQKATILSKALPYIQKYNGRIVVIEYGGNAMKNEVPKQDVMTDIILLLEIGVYVVLVYGGGPEISGILHKVGRQSRFVAELRYTDEETMDVVRMVLAGKTNKDLVSLINQKEARAADISGMDASCIQVKQYTVDEDDLGYVGEIEEIHEKLILDIIEKSYIPVMASVSCSVAGHAYNINAGAVAVSIAAKLHAESMILVGNIPGLLRNPEGEGSLIPKATLSEIEELKKNGVISDEMIPKVNRLVTAVQGSVQWAVITDGRVPHSILIEMLSEEGVGTPVEE